MDFFLFYRFYSLDLLIQTMFNLTNLLMKVTREVYEQMKSDIKVVLDSYKLNQLKFIDLKVCDYYTIWHFVYMNRRYLNDNKNILFVNNKRILDHDPEFEYYPCDTNDDSLGTALKKILNELLG